MPVSRETDCLDYTMVLVLSLTRTESRLAPFLDTALLGGGSTSGRGRSVGLAGNDAAIVTTAAAVAAGATAFTASTTRATVAVVV